MNTFFWIAAILIIPWLCAVLLALIGAVLELDWRNIDIYLWPRRRRP